MKKNLKVIVLFLGIYILSTGVSWASFSLVGNKNISDITSDLTGLQNARSRIAEIPKTEVCPLNGEMFTKVEKEIWEERRPMGVMIENHLDSRPQSGLSRADIVYEVVAEGGITRFLALYYCGAAAEDVTIGPVRSTRVYFINLISEYGLNPLYVHFGGANNICGNCPGGVKTPGTVNKKVLALEKLVDMGWRYSNGNALDGGANVPYPAIKRDQYRLGDEPAAWEHSAIGSTDALFDLGLERGFGYEDSDGVSWNDDFVSWNFVDEKPLATPAASKISFEFWSNKSDYDVEWQYDAASNNYKRINGGKAHVDWEYDNSQLLAKNVVIQFVKEEGPLDSEYHMYYEVSGKGDAIFFMNGDVIEGSWSKKDQYSRTIFYGEDGEELNFVRGKIWIELLPIGNTVNY